MLSKYTYEIHTTNFRVVDGVYKTIKFYKNIVEVDDPGRYAIFPYFINSDGHEMLYDMLVFDTYLSDKRITFNDLYKTSRVVVQYYEKDREHLTSEFCVI